MDLKSIVNKVIEGTKLLLVQPTMFFRDLTDSSLKRKHIVLADEAGRPDLIADRIYGDHRMADIILKYNRISDPFSIAEGETLRIPVDSIAYYRLERPQFSEANNIVKTQFTDTKRLSKADQNRVAALKKKYGKEELLPPNVVPTGRKTYMFDNGLVRMGKEAQTAPVTNSTTTKEIAARNTKEVPADKTLLERLDGDANFTLEEAAELSKLREEQLKNQGDEQSRADDAREADFRNSENNPNQ
jgi:hypothetical protein|tara:strand:- start:5493 stop:6224 length:732 start_codon:yes stop_codon:yes gene_type:complete